MSTGAMPPLRPINNVSSPLLLQVWKPQYALDVWAAEYAGAFA